MIIIKWMAGFCLAALFGRAALARDWTITPKLTLKEMYSDNIGLNAAALKSAAWVSEIAPGFLFKRDSGRSHLNLNYRLQNLFYLGIAQDPRILNQLQMNSKTELVDDAIYLDASGSMGQANISSIGNLAIDNATTQANSTEFRTFRLSPYWKAHLSGYAQGEARLGYSQVSNSGGTNIGSNIYQQLVNFQNGPYSDQYDWRVNLNHQDIQRTQSQAGVSGDVVYLNYNGELGYRLGSRYRLFIQAGCYDNNFQNLSLISSVKNGCYELLGVAYTPHPRLNLAAGLGFNQKFAFLNWSPKARTQLQIIYRDSQVGGANQNGVNPYGGGVAIDTQATSGTRGAPLGGANAGSTWNGIFQHRTLRSSWNASYTVSVTTIQQILLETQVFSRQLDAQGNPLLNGIPIDVPTLTNDVITRKRAQISVTGFLQKSSLSLSAYQEHRTYQSPFNPPQDILGMTASLNWRFASQTHASLQATWQQIDQAFPASKNELFYGLLMLTRQVSPDLNVSFEIRHLQQDSNRIGAQYAENRATASLNVSF